MNMYSFYVLTHRVGGSIIHVSAHTVEAANIKEARKIADNYTPPAVYDNMYHTHSEVVKERTK